MKRLIIVHGESNSGKTTVANTLCSRLDEAEVRLGGVLQTVPIPGIPKIEYQAGDLATGRVKVLCSTETPPDKTWVPWQHFYLNPSAFQWACEVLLNAPERSDLVVIDEVGQLELAGEGFAPALNTLVGTPTWRLLLVIRSALVEKVAQYFSLPLSEALLLPCSEEIDLLYSQLEAYLELT